MGEVQNSTSNLADSLVVSVSSLVKSTTSGINYPLFSKLNSIKVQVTLAQKRTYIPRRVIHLLKGGLLVYIPFSFLFRRIVYLFSVFLLKVHVYVFRFNKNLMAAIKLVVSIRSCNWIFVFFPSIYCFC